MTSISGTVHVVLQGGGRWQGGCGYGQGPAWHTCTDRSSWEKRREGGKKQKGLDKYPLRFTVRKQLSLPIRLSFMFSFGLFLVA